MRSKSVAVAAALVLMLGACGGGDDDADDVAGSNDPAPATQPADDSGGADDGTAPPADNGGDAGVAGTDQPALSADPGTAYADVDGDRIVYESAGSLYYTCEIDADNVQVNFQTAEGQDLSIQAGRDSSGWRGQLTFKAAGGGNTQYSVVFAQSSGTFGVGDGALSYQGGADRIVDFDPTNAEEVEASIAVNCAPTGDGSDPQAVIDGTTYIVALSGAQSVTCAVSPEDVDITINRLALENLQLSIDMRGGPDDWIGSVFVITPDGDFTVTLSGAAEGLTIDGNTVTYEGPIGTEGGDVPASVYVTCP